MQPLLSNSPQPGKDRTGSTAIVFEIVRTSQVFFFDGENAVFVHRSKPPTLTEIGNLPTPGLYLASFNEKDELQQCLKDTEHESFILNNSETLRVIARFTL